MQISSRNIFIIYLILYLSLLIGFYFNEDSVGGYFSDFTYHTNVVASFKKDFLYALLHYDEIDFKTGHSPIYIIFFVFLEKISPSENIARLVNLHFSLLLPYFFYLSLKLKYKFKSNDIKILLPAIIFISPYFRSSSVWMGSENISLVFLSISFYFFLKYENNKKNEIYYIILNTLFLALAAYIRPNYAIFSIYFLAKYFYDLQVSKKLLVYIFVNIFLSFPAIYYVYILDVNFLEFFISRPINFSSVISQFAIIISIIFFYSIPFLLSNIRQNFQLHNFKATNLFISIFFVILLFFNFDYSFPYGGGFFYRFSDLVFNNNYLFYILSFVILNVFILTFIHLTKKEQKIFDLLILLVLLFLEIDHEYFQETYDPLLYLVFFLFLKNGIYLNFIKNFNDKKFFLLIVFCIIFYVTSVFKTSYSSITMPDYSVKNIYFKQ